ncbi:MAG TPA: AAA family ATPase [Ktedonobacteraceae bacterium]|nr:AAA family ATPase [Ktedonobacteraceae bacterium]
MSQPLRIQNPFVGRKREQQAYQQLLAQSAPWMLIITGDGGIGKSTLLRYLAEHTPQDIPVVTLNFAVESLRTDPIKILEELSWKLALDTDAQRVAAFEKSLQEGRDRLSELSKQMSQTVIVGDAGSLKDAQLSMSGADAAAAREQRRQVREMVTKAFYAQMLTFQPAHLVIMLDTCEWLSEPEGLEVGRWVVDELIPGMQERLIQRRHRCSVVIAGRTLPPLTVIDQRDRTALSLPRLEQAAVDNYLEQLGMQDAAMRRRVYDITYGHSLCVSIIGILWQEQGDRPFTIADLPQLHTQFNEKALLEYVQERLDKRLKSPFRELTHYGVLLRSFNLPMLKVVFPELMPEGESLDYFHQLTSYPYVEKPGDQRYAFHDLLREIQAVEIREQQPEKWKEYHKRALDYLSRVAPFSADWYYHAIAFDEGQGMSDWWDAVQNPRNYGTAFLGSLFEAAYDVTLSLTPSQAAHRAYQLGRFYYSGYGFQLDMAIEQYQEAYALFRQVGDRLGEANCYLAQGRLALAQDNYQLALDLHNQAYLLYQQIQARYSQAVLLYYRSFVYEEMRQLPNAIQDAEGGLAIAKALELPFVDLFEKRLNDLRSQLYDGFVSSRWHV